MAGRNVLAALEAEVAVGVSAGELAARADVTITLRRARSFLSNMGYDISATSPCIFSTNDARGNSRVHEASMYDAVIPRQVEHKMKRKLYFQVDELRASNDGVVIVAGRNCGDTLNSGDLFEVAYPSEVRKTDYSCEYHMRPGRPQRINHMFIDAREYSDFMQFLGKGHVGLIRLQGARIPQLGPGWVLANDLGYDLDCQSMRSADEYLSQFKEYQSTDR